MAQLGAVQADQSRSLGARKSEVSGPSQSRVQVGPNPLASSSDRPAAGAFVAASQFLVVPAPAERSLGNPAGELARGRSSPVEGVVAEAPGRH